MRRLIESPKRCVVMLTVVALSAVALLAVSSIVVASHELTKSADKQLKTTAAVSSVVIGEQTSNLVALVESYASRLSLSSGVAAGKGGAGVSRSRSPVSHTPSRASPPRSSPTRTSLSTYPAERFDERPSETRLRPSPPGGWPPRGASARFVC